MLGIPRRYAHFIYGVIQSGLTSAIVAAVTSFQVLGGELLFSHWLQSWLIAWALMLPIVVIAAPVIRRLTVCLTREDLGVTDNR